MFRLKINGTAHDIDAGPDTPMLWVLREMLGLTGTKYGCGIGECGACMIHVDGKAMQSCQLPIAAAEGLEITTIEGLSPDAQHPVQVAWRAVGVPQCGFCQSGQIMSAAALLAANPAPAEDAIRAAMNGNICRCGTYPRIHAAITEASRLLGGVDKAENTSP